MQKKSWFSIAMALIGAGLLVAAAFAGSASSAPQSKKSAAKVGGTLRVNLSTTDIQFSDPALEYETTGWQIEYATALKLLNWKETKAQLFPEAATAFPRVGLGGHGGELQVGFHARDDAQDELAGRRLPRRPQVGRDEG